MSIAKTRNQRKMNSNLEFANSDDTKQVRAMEKREQNMTSRYQFEQC